VTFPPLSQPKLVLEQATPEGCKAELVQLAGYIRKWYTHPKAVTHPSTNRARRALTSFTTPGRQHDHQISHHTKFVSLVYWHRHACLCICPASVCLSVCLSQHGPQQRSLLLWPGRQEMSIDCCTAHSCSAAGECGQCHVVSVRSSCNADL